LKNNDLLPEIKDFEEKEKEYTSYQQSFGDCNAPKEFNFQYGKLILVGHGKVTNSYCGKFQTFKICNRIELHGQSEPNGESHSGQVFVRLSHHWCHKFECPICYLHGACKREADHISQRIEKASVGYVDEKGIKHSALGSPQHIIISPCSSDWGLFELNNREFMKKAKAILNEVGVFDGCIIPHGFRYADYWESISKKIPFGWYFSPHAHVIGFIEGGYGACRHCSKTAYFIKTKGGKTVSKHGDSKYCFSCDGFERRVRESYKKHGYIISNTDERASVFGTAWYQLSHMTIERNDT
jgi:hypothetical protein